LPLRSVTGAILAYLWSAAAAAERARGAPQATSSRVAVTRQRLSEPDAAAALADFAQYTIVRYDFTGIASLTFDLSGQY
jgi:hypothetical protein